MLEPFFNQNALQNRYFPVTIIKFLRTYFEEHQQTAASVDSSLCLLLLKLTHDWFYSVPLPFSVRIVTV